MNRLAYLAAMALLGIGLTLAQNTKPSSDPSNSSNTSSQPQSDNSAPQASGKDQIDAGSAKRHRNGSASSKDAVPDPTIHDQQGSTTSTTDPSGQSNRQPSTSTMGTAGSTPGTPEQKQPATMPQNGTPPDQQPNSSTGPDTATPHAALLQTPAARAVSTHTPDPGTCMNPAALQTAADGTQPSNAPRCR
jgi:FtsZ-interacting cell division protein ZipA